MDIAGHAAVVTGGGSGMGAETARYLARAGAKVALLDVNTDGARAVAEEIGGLAVECDVSDASSTAAAVAAAEAAHGPARICISCASGPVFDTITRESSTSTSSAHSIRSDWPLRV